MRNVVDARSLVTSAAREAGLDHALTDRIFEGTPLDFPVIFTDRLPLGAGLLGMIGITLLGRVYLHSSMRSSSPEALLFLLRHEAEHVRQQRRDRILFYPRYILGWLRRFAMELSSASDAERRVRRAWHRAYRMIPAEQEAYGAEARARILLDGDRAPERS